MLLADGGVGLAALRIDLGEWPLCAHNVVFLGCEVQDGPREDPQEGEVEDPSDPVGGAPVVHPGGGVDINRPIGNGKLNGELALVVGTADETFESGSEELLIQAGDCAGKAEAGIILLVLRLTKGNSASSLTILCS